MIIELVLAAALPLMGGESAHVKAKIADCDRYAALNPHFPKAFAFLKRGDLASLKPGRYEIDGDNCWAMVQEVKLTPFADGAKVEAHRKYIDIQSPLTGEATTSLTLPTGFKPVIPAGSEVVQVTNEGGDLVGLKIRRKRPGLILILR